MKILRLKNDEFSDISGVLCKIDNFLKNSP